MTEPQPLGNQPPQPPPPRPPANGDDVAGFKFMAGVIVGSAVSAWVWLGHFAGLSQAGLIGHVFAGLVFGKGVGGSLMAANTTTRAFGIGLLVSLPLGGLLFFVGCGQNFKL